MRKGIKFVKVLEGESWKGIIWGTKVAYRMLLDDSMLWRSQPTFEISNFILMSIRG